MAKLRVHELAKELGTTSKVVLQALKDSGEFVKSASSTIEAPVARKMREHFAKLAVEVEAAAPKIKEAKKKVASKTAKVKAAKKAKTQENETVAAAGTAKEDNKPAPSEEAKKAASIKPGPKPGPKPAPKAEKPKSAPGGPKPAPKPGKSPGSSAPKPAPRAGAPRPGNNPFASAQGMPRPGGPRPGNNPFASSQGMPRPGGTSGQRKSSGRGRPGKGNRRQSSATPDVTAGTIPQLLP